MQNTEKAFYWILDILERNHISYKVSGGFAARMYGVKRELADIDIELADSDIAVIAEEVAPYDIFGPARYKDDNWDLELLTLRYKGQDIDIAGKSALIFNQQTGMWEAKQGSLEDVTIKEYAGRSVRVESLASLIAYKTKLGREVDREDVRQLTHIAGNK